jgi:hypothetical protein
VFSGETGKQKRFYAFCNKLYSNKLIRYKNAFLLIFVADMSLDKTSITSENQRILVIQLRLFNNSIYILPSNQPNNAIKKYFPTYTFYGIYYVADVAELIISTFCIIMGIYRCSEVVAECSGM